MKFQKLLTLSSAAFLFFSAAAQTVDLQSSVLPIVVINTEGRPIVDDPKVKARMGIINKGEGQLNHINDEFNDYDGFIGIELRGSSSQALFPKKSFGFETWDEAEEEIDTMLLGFPSEQDWVLHGPYSDKTLMRNKLTFDLYAKTGRYSSRTRYVELVLNGQYHGVYILMEKVKRDKNRVDIATLREEDNSGDELTGGYIIKLDKFDGSGGDGFASLYPPPNAQSNQQVFFQYDEPQEDEITGPQQTYIQEFIRKFENSLRSNTFRDPQTGYYQYVDLGSFADFFLINEINKNVDGYRLSTFMHKDKDSNDGRLHMGPIWDFNLAFGNADYCEGGSPQGWAYRFNYVCPGDFWLVPFWWEKMLTDDRFRALTKGRWLSLRENEWSDEAIMAMIEEYVELLSEAQDRNFRRWPVLGEYVWPNNYVGDTFEEEVNYLKLWITDRLAWLDAEIGAWEIPLTTGTDHPESTTKVYPNPFSSGLNIHTSGPEAVVAVRIYDLRGSLLRSLTPKGREIFWDGTSQTGGALPPGAYLLQLLHRDGRSTVEKVIKSTE